MTKNRVVRTTPARAILRREGHPVARRKYIAAWLWHGVPAAVSLLALAAMPIVALHLGVS